MFDKAILEVLAELEREKCVEYTEKVNKNEKRCKNMKKDEKKN